MSKGTRKREAAAIRRAEEERLEQARQKKARRNKIILSCVAALAVVAIVVGTFAIIKHKRANDPDYLLHNTIVATSDNYEVTQAMMTYFMRSTFMNFANQNADYLEQMELNTQISLKSQTCYFSEDITWFDYFAETTKDSVNWMLGFAEEAKAKGLALTEEDKDAIEKTLKEVTPSTFGEYITKEDIRACLELYYMADKQEAKVQANLIATDADVKAFADKHQKDLVQADIMYYGIAYGGTNPYKDKETAEALAEKLMKASPEEFKALLKVELVENRKLYTADSFEEKYESFCVKKDHTYMESDGFSQWLFDGKTKAGDTFRFDETKDTIMVMMCLTTPDRDRDLTMNVRHILFKSDTHGEEGAKKKAEDLLAQWKAGDATEASFGELAKTHTEDSNGEQGGLYENVYPGQMVTNFNDWCFSKDRKPGDTGVVKTDYGYHVMYFVSPGVEMWYLTAKESFLNESYNTTYQGYLTKYHVNIVDEAVQDVDM